jgi:hypothetical protein
VGICFCGKSCNSSVFQSSASSDEVNNRLLDIPNREQFGEILKPEVPCVFFSDGTSDLSRHMMQSYALFKYCDLTPEGQNSGPEETSIARQRLGKHVPDATNMQRTIERLLGNCVFCWVRLRLCNEHPGRAADED